jgi:hypothetical protein
LTGLNSSGGVIIVADASRFERVEDRKRAGVVGALLTGLDSSGGVIIVIDASKFERVKNGEHAGVIGDI